MAARYSSDKRTATNGGNLGVLRKTSIYPGMAEVIFGMRPGAISEPLASPLGADIVQRLSWADAQSRYVPAYNQATRNSADSAASDEIAAASDLRLMNVALDAARIAAEDPANHSRDTTVIATFDRGGKQTVADMLAWANTLAPEQRTEVLTSLPAVNDSIARYVVRSLVVRGVLLRAADSAKVQAPDSLAPSLRARFIGSVLNEWKTLGVSPAQLATGAKTPAERERLAAQRVDALFERGMRGQAPLPPVPIGVEAALDATYGTKLSEEGLQRAFEAAVALRGSGSTMQRQPVQ